MVTLSLAELPGNTTHFILATGGLDNKIHLHCDDSSGKEPIACINIVVIKWFSLGSLARPVLPQFEFEDWFGILTKGTKPRTLLLTRWTDHDSSSRQLSLPLNLFFLLFIFFAARELLVSLHSFGVTDLQGSWCSFKAAVGWETRRAMASALNVIPTYHSFADYALLSKAVESGQESLSPFMVEMAKIQKLCHLSTSEAVEFLERFLAMNPDTRYEILIENLMEPVHVPYAHYGIMRMPQPR
ncbi:hypothetical protein L2E82_17287 [Cichorium intybus]|uniref:Uncharacterized protein n=1 Tax=Cichorium intybus TaxID=13427 RepID=A0ACB9F7B8_CICIN|nr:hypothetical protein L2E82_17287 [Cichorium intybus]